MNRDASAGSDRESHTFRLSISVLFWGLLGLAGCGSATIACGWLAMFEPPPQGPHEGPRLLLSAIIFGVMSVLCAYLILAWHREQLSFDGSKIVRHAVLGPQEFDRSEIERLVWRTMPVGGRVVCYVLGRRFKFDLGKYRDEDRLQAIRLFRGAVIEDRQQDWQKFCQAIALPLRDRRLAPIIDEPDVLAARGDTVVTRRRYDRLAAVLLPGVLVASLLVWWLASSPIVFSLLLILTMAWLLLRFSVRPGGELQQHIGALPVRGELLSIVMGPILAGLAAAAVRLAGWGRDAGCAAALLVLAPITFVGFVRMHRAAQQRKLRAEAEAVTAPARWLEGEASRRWSAS